MVQIGLIPVEVQYVRSHSIVMFTWLQKSSLLFKFIARAGE
jgi:hypothetical protein